MLEQLADHNDALLEKLLEDAVPAKEEVFSSLSAALTENTVVPVFFGAAEQDAGVFRLLKTLRHDVTAPQTVRARLPEMTAPAEEITVPGNLFELDFSDLPADSLRMMETEFHLDAPRKVRLLVNTPANMRVWVDGEFRFGRESGPMVPAFHRALLNQMCDLELEAGTHTLTMGFAPACGKMNQAQVLFGLADSRNHWLTDVFRK